MNSFFAASVFDTLEFFLLFVIVFVVVPGTIIWCIYAYAQDLWHGEESFVRTTWQGVKRLAKALWEILWNF